MSSYKTFVVRIGLVKTSNGTNAVLTNSIQPSAEELKRCLFKCDVVPS